MFQWVKSPRSLLQASSFISATKLAVASLATGALPIFPLLAAGKKERNSLGLLRREAGEPWPSGRWVDSLVAPNTFPVEIWNRLEIGAEQLVQTSFCLRKTEEALSGANNFWVLVVSQQAQGWGPLVSASSSIRKILNKSLDWGWHPPYFLDHNSSSGALKFQFLISTLPSYFSNQEVMLCWPISPKMYTNSPFYCVLWIVQEKMAF